MCTYFISQRVLVAKWQMVIMHACHFTSLVDCWFFSLVLTNLAANKIKKISQQVNDTS